MSVFGGKEDWHYYEAYLSFTQRDIFVYVESRDDFKFWRRNFKRLVPEIKFDFAPVGKEKSEKTRELINEKKNDEGTILWVFANSAYNYLIEEDIHDLKEEKESYLFQTYTYSTDNYKCFSEGLEEICFELSSNPKNVFNFKEFLADYSKTVYPLFLYSLFFYKKFKGDTEENPFKCNDFRECIEIGDEKPDISENGKTIIQELKRRVDNKIEMLNKDKEIEVEVKKLEKKISKKNRGINRKKYRNKIKTELCSGRNLFVYKRETCFRYSPSNNERSYCSSEK